MLKVAPHGICTFQMRISSRGPRSAFACFSKIFQSFGWSFRYLAEENVGGALGLGFGRVLAAAEVVAKVVRGGGGLVAAVRTRCTTKPSAMASHVRFSDTSSTTKTFFVAPTIAPERQSSHKHACVSAECA